VGIRAAARRILPGRSAPALQPYYRPEPDLDDIPADWWMRRHPLRGITLDLDGQLAFVRDALAAYIDEFAPPRAPSGRPSAYHVDNGSFESVDAELAYAMVRHLSPSRIIELGSGFSTLAMAEACVANAADGSDTQLRSIDPGPRVGPAAAVPGLDSIDERRAQDLTIGDFEQLRSGDIVFVDTSHIVKTAGEVNFLVLEVLPMLQPGVVVHFHDVFLPYEYHRGFLESGRYFTEQYLVQAFLSMNSSYEIVLAAHAMLRERKAELARLVPSLEDHQPSSLWIRRI
jgi:predicted O-methyltransferase YrrM